MGSTTAQSPTPKAAVLDLGAARLVSARWDEARQSLWLVLAYPGSVGEYEIQGRADGRDASCTCPGFTRWQRCKHVASLCLFWAELRRQEYAKLPTAELRGYLDWYSAQDTLTDDERTVQGAIRAVLAARGVRVAAHAAVVARGKAAVSDLFEEA